jgi:hypothetical protein
MYPEIRQDHPGARSKGGMALELLTATTEDNGEPHDMER